MQDYRLQLEEEVVPLEAEIGEAVGSAPPYPVLYMAEIHRPGGALHLRGKTSAFGQYSLFVPRDGTVLLVSFYDPRANEWGIAYPRVRPDVPFLLRRFYLQPIDDSFPDFDNDGLVDAVELVYGTDTANPDTDGDGIPDGGRVKRSSRKWYIEYRDADGVKRRVPGYGDRKATLQLAAELERSAERQQAGIIDEHQLEVAHHAREPIGKQFSGYQYHLQAAGVSDRHLKETLRRLTAITSACGFRRLADVKAEPVNRWCNLHATEGMSNRTRNTYVGSLRAFIRWAMADGRLTRDPLVTLSKASERIDIRRHRRAFSEDELARLLEVAESRPIHDAMMIRHGPRKGQLGAKLSAHYRRHLERSGRERRLIYMTLVLTGLRRGELATLQWGDMTLERPNAWLTVRAQNAKNRCAESVPLRADLVDELCHWRTENGNPANCDLVFNVPRGFVVVLNRDLKAAGIQKIDDEGRTIDVHAFRHTTATYLAKAGVAPRVAQSLLRHSDIRLTLGTYTDPSLLDTSSALGALPSLGGEQSDGATRTAGGVIQW